MPARLSVFLKVRLFLKSWWLRHSRWRCRRWRCSIEMVFMAVRVFTSPRKRTISRRISGPKSPSQVQSVLIESKVQSPKSKVKNKLHHHTCLNSKFQIPKRTLDLGHWTLDGKKTLDKSFLCLYWFATAPVTRTFAA